MYIVPLPSFNEAWTINLWNYNLQTCYTSMWRMWFSWLAIYINILLHFLCIHNTITHSTKNLSYNVNFILDIAFRNCGLWVITSQFELLHVENIICFSTVQSMFANDNEKPPLNNVLLITCKYWFSVCKSSYILVQNTCNFVFTKII